MKVTAVSWPRVDLWPRQQLIRLLDSLVIDLDDRRALYLPKGIYSDGASVPNLLWGVLEATPTQMLLPGLVHDAAYRTDALWTLLGGERMPITRPEADDLLRALALYCGCSELDAAKLRWGVGVGGASSFHQKTLDWRP